MKLKRQHDDFQVEELPTVRGGGRGRFGFYRLTKRGMGSLEAIEAVARRWNLAARQISYGGLKDRHAATIQYLTIFEGPDRGLNESSFSLEPLGRLEHPYGPSFFRGNRFVVVLRDMDAEAAARAGKALAEIPRDGLPNYFDDQRFGSVGFDGDFIARAWLQGQFDRALWLAIAAPTASDRPDARAEKAILRDHWNNWAEAKARLPRSHARSLVTYLVDHPQDHRGAFARLRRELRSIYFSAFQSYLWNVMLGRMIERETRADQRVAVDFKLGPMPVQHGLDEEQAAGLKALRIPLPSSRNPLPPGALGEIAAAVLGESSLTWEAIRVKYLKDVFFSKGDRPALFEAREVSHEILPDDLYPGRFQARLKFELGKGSYATLVVKRITVVAGVVAEGGDGLDEDADNASDPAGG